MSTFQNARFYTTVNHIKDLPSSRAEVAVVGRSNAGKSSVINTLANHIRLARVSKSPGRTQHINFFEVGNECFFVDLPGYGYAAVPEKVRNHWVELLGHYLQSRKSLIGLLLIMDARHPLRELDHKMLKFFRVTRRPVHILLSKCDKLSHQAQCKVLRAVRRELEEHAEVSVQIFSSLKKRGVDEVEGIVSGWFDQVICRTSLVDGTPIEL